MVPKNQATSSPTFHRWYTHITLPRRPHTLTINESRVHRPGHIGEPMASHLAAIRSTSSSGTDFLQGERVREESTRLASQRLPAEAVRERPTVVIRACLRRSRSKRCCTAENGILEALRKGAVLIDSTPVIRRLLVRSRPSSADVVWSSSDAPVSGGVCRREFRNV